MAKFIRNAVRSCLIVGLKWADIFAQRAFFVMQAYLTDVRGLSFTHAASVMNLWDGMCRGVFQPLFQYLAIVVLGNFMVVVISSISSTVGIGFVTMSLSPALGKCRRYELECIGVKQKALFYAGMALTAVGRAGLYVSIPALQDEQSSDGIIAWLRQHGPTLDTYVVYGVATLMISWTKNWTSRFAVPAIYTAVATLCFLIGWRMYEKPCPRSRPNQTTDHGKEPSPSSSTHSPSEIRQDQVNENTSPQLDDEAAKFLVRMIPLSINAMICGTVCSLGNTYFVEQADHMTRKFGELNVPLVALQLPFILFTKLIVEPILRLIMICNLRWIPKKHQNLLPTFGIASAIFHSILCCVIAALVEKQRLHVVRSNGLVDKPHEVVPMHVAWLIFQFFLLVAMDSFFILSTKNFYETQAPENMKKDKDIYFDTVSGLGFVFNVFLTFVAGKLSGIGGKSWIQPTLNRSRLDRYYWMLAALTSLNLLAFVVAATSYARRSRKAEARREAGGRTGRNGDCQPSSGCCCCC